MATDNNAFDAKVVGYKEPQGIDVKPHVGKLVKIASIERHPRSPDGTGLGKYGPVLKVNTETVETIQKQDGTGDIELKGSRIFSLQEQEDGSISWGKKLQDFLVAHEVAHYNDLIGKEVQLQATPSKREPNTKFLTFE